MENCKAFFTSKPPLLTELCLTAVGLNHFARGDEIGGGGEFRVECKTAKAFFTSKPPLLKAELCLTAVGLNHFAGGDEKGRGEGLVHKQQNPLRFPVTLRICLCRGP
ncbi:hypothetical protein CEXT_200581 [Caerostris extrusa]|uniref:Uncharacterized protein n=1 Tax=Caerostris extrusa TaxID=172846 RepID=A0AAV4MUJ7_CAEEX|nr:hypothetical protein CEXT_200581 [Caerostris extrusa]